MLHWFHCLRDLGRKKKEAVVKSTLNNEDLCIARIIMELEPIKLWTRRERRRDPVSEIIIKMEEFRTIIGYTVQVTKTDGTILYSPENAVNGDDLCENLYRVCIRENLRYGHVNISEGAIILLPKKIIERAIEFCDSAVSNGHYKVNS